MLAPPGEGGRLDFSVADAADGDAGAHDPMAIGDDGETPPGLPPAEVGAPDDGGGGGEYDEYNPHVRSPLIPSLPRAIADSDSVGNSQSRFVACCVLACFVCQCN